MTAALIADALPSDVTLADAARWPTCPEAAEILNVDESTVRRKVRSGKYQGAKIGGVVRVNPASLSADVEPVGPGRRGRKLATRSASAAAAERRMREWFAKGKQK